MCNNQPVLLIVVTHHGIHASRSCKMQSLTKYIKIKISQPNSIFFGSKSFFLVHQLSCYRFSDLTVNLFWDKNWFELMFLYNSLVSQGSQ